MSNSNSINMIKSFYRKFNAIQYNGNNFEDVKLFIANHDKFHVGLFNYYYINNPYYEDGLRIGDSVGIYLENISTFRYAILYVNDWLYFDEDNRIATNCSEVMSELFSGYSEVGSEVEVDLDSKVDIN